ncbi:hypothetical protein PEPS_29180 (plasmid) [Persicobacter psychrovividus]|uniref:Uncharacterized protein n=1 Tax=Persicobacter psychrovividus TaxID=387638 RepID=A0ABM7VI45_9BACT|nr:hypothetical protein PEPS_29180 [Persicobacter psychrovividus]
MPLVDFNLYQIKVNFGDELNMEFFIFLNDLDPTPPLALFVFYQLLWPCTGATK